MNTEPESAQQTIVVPRAPIDLARHNVHWLTEEANRDDAAAGTILDAAIRAAIARFIDLIPKEADTYEALREAVEASDLAGLQQLHPADRVHEVLGMFAHDAATGHDLRVPGGRVGDLVLVAEGTPSCMPEAGAASFCDECGAAIPDDVPDLVNAHHETSCSLHPDNVV